MFVRIIGLLWICALITTATAQVPNTMWDRTYGDTGADICRSVWKTSDGGYALGGYTNSYGAGGPDFYLVRTDENGDTLWTRTYGGADLDECYSVQQTVDGGYMLGGTTKSFGAGWQDFWLVKTDANGDTVWTRAYGGANSDYCYYAQQTSDGGFMLAGQTSSFGLGCFWMVKTDAGGNVEWSRAYGNGLAGYCYSACEMSDGGFVMVGDALVTYGDILLMKLAADGDSLWSRLYGGSNFDRAYSVRETGDGSLVLAGVTKSFGSGNEDFYLIKTDDDGDTLWTRTYGGSSYEYCYSVQQTSDGGYILGGNTHSFGAGNYDCWLVKASADGDSLWSLTFGGSSGDGIYSAVQASEEHYVFGGFTSSFDVGNGDFWMALTCHPDVPLPPEDLVITAVGSDARLDWFPVLQDTVECFMDDIHYLVFYSPTAEGEFYYHGYTTDTTYVHPGVVAYSGGMFYELTAMKGLPPALLSVPAGTDRREVRALINR